MQEFDFMVLIITKDAFKILGNIEGLKNLYFKKIYVCTKSKK